MYAHTVRQSTHFSSIITLNARTYAGYSNYGSAGNYTIIIEAQDPRECRLVSVTAVLHEAALNQQGCMICCSSASVLGAGARQDCAAQRAHVLLYCAAGQGTQTKPARSCQRQRQNPNRVPEPPPAAPFEQRLRRSTR